MNNSIKQCLYYIKEDMKANGSIGIDYPVRWFIGEENARVKLYLIVYRIYEYLTNTRNPILKIFTPPSTFGINGRVLNMAFFYILTPLDMD